MGKKLASGIKIWVISNMEARLEPIKASELPWRAGCKGRKLSSEDCSFFQKVLARLEKLAGDKLLQLPTDSLFTTGL